MGRLIDRSPGAFLIQSEFEGGAGLDARTKYNREQLKVRFLVFVFVVVVVVVVVDTAMFCLLVCLFAFVFVFFFIFFACLLTCLLALSLLGRWW